MSPSLTIAYQPIERNHRHDAAPSLHPSLLIKNYWTLLTTTTITYYHNNYYYHYYYYITTSLNEQPLTHSLEYHVCMNLSTETVQATACTL